MRTVAVTILASLLSGAALADAPPHVVTAGPEGEIDARAQPLASLSIGAHTITVSDERGRTHETAIVVK